MSKNSTQDQDRVRRADAVHREAMELADVAFLAKQKGDLQQAREYNSQAFEKEREAANTIADRYDLEPSRSVLYRSAATLALVCGNLREAERMAACGLSNENAPDEIAEELRDILTNVHCHRHHNLQGITLHPNVLQLSLEGAAVGHGFTQANLVEPRVRDVSALLRRTMSRLLGRSFEESGYQKQSPSEGEIIYLSTPVAASYAIGLRIGTRDSKQLPLQGMEHAIPGIDLSTKTIDEFLICIDLINKKNREGLIQRISDKMYRNNFLSLATRIAPDGREIHSVGFSTSQNNQDLTVVFSTPKSTLKNLDLSDSTPTDTEQIEIRGKLLEANAMRQRTSSIQVIDDSQKRHKIKVPREMIADIVKPMFEEDVVVTVTRKGGENKLLSIDYSDQE